MWRRDPTSEKCIAGHVKQSRPRHLSCVSQPAVARENVTDKQEMEQTKTEITSNKKEITVETEDKLNEKWAHLNKNSATYCFNCIALWVFVTFALLQQCCDDSFVLYRVEWTGGVDHPPSYSQLFDATHCNTQLEPGEHTHARCNIPNFF